MKYYIFTLFLIFSTVGISQNRMRAQISNIEIEETDGSNAPFIEFKDSTGNQQFVWFQLAYSPMGTELMVGENIAVFCTPEEIQIGDNVISRCQYTMNDGFTFEPSDKEYLIHYSIETNDLGDEYWIISWIEAVEN